MHVVTWCNTDFKLKRACLYYLDIGWANGAQALARGANMPSPITSPSAAYEQDIVSKSSSYPMLHTEEAFQLYYLVVF